MMGLGIVRGLRRVEGLEGRGDIFFYFSFF
jgi:hypothetical protein